MKGNKKMRKKGFTLIELLVVIAIIGLLSTMAVVSLNGARAKARDAQRISDLKQMSTALEIYQTSAGDYHAFQDYNGVISNGNLVDDVATNDPNLTSKDEMDNIRIFSDPSGTDVCTNSTTAPCQYTLSKLTADTYSIVTYFENGTPIGNKAKGIHCITQGSLWVNDSSNCF